MANEIVNDESKLLQIFPNEVWDKILENVKKVRVYHKISIASPGLRVRLLPRASQVLFPEVIEILIERQPKPILDPGWIANRRVCQAWKAGLDEMLEAERECRIMHKRNQKLNGFSDTTFEFKHRLEHVLRFKSAESFAKFEEHFDATHLDSGANPILRRKVTLFIGFIAEPPERFYTACFQFLEKYGHHLWFCKIYCGFGRNMQADFYSRKLSVLLNAMPNLVYLQISYVPSFWRDQVDLPIVALPTLPDLGFIELKQVPTVIVQELLRRNPQVKNLYTLEYSVPLNIILDGHPNLREVAFRISQGREMELAQLTNPAPVERMRLSLAVNQNYQQVFLELKRHFSESLVQLYIYLPVDAMMPNTRLELPRLKVLSLKMFNPQRLDFLLPLKDSLEELHLYLHSGRKVQEECELVEQNEGEISLLQVFKFWKEPHKSNIWSLFPKLRVLDIHVYMTGKYCCTRKEWQAFKDAQESPVSY